MTQPPVKTSYSQWLEQFKQDADVSTALIMLKNPLMINYCFVFSRSHPHFPEGDIPDEPVDIAHVWSRISVDWDFIEGALNMSAGEYLPLHTSCMTMGLIYPDGTLPHVVNQWVNRQINQ